MQNNVQYVQVQTEAGIEWFLCICAMHSMMSCLTISCFLYLTWCLCMTEVTCNSEDYEIYSEVDYSEHYTNEWATRIYGGPQIARIVARDHGYEYLIELAGVPDTYLFRKVEIQKRSLEESLVHTENLNNDFRVMFAHQQQIKRREKRNNKTAATSMSAFHKLNAKEKCDSHFKDPLWKNQWYLCNKGSNTKEHALNFHVERVWNSGITGKGIIVCIVDDGLEWNHTDIFQNYDPLASYDATDYDPDPFPNNQGNETNEHGTYCAGTVAMVANNSACGVGIAFNAKVGAVRMLDAHVTDAVEASSLGFNCKYTHIYSASWGPPDNGKSIGGPGHLTQEIFERCTSKGRNGKGDIYVWAAGNGGHAGDNCNYDGFVNSIYTIAIGGIKSNGKVPDFAEPCAATVASTFSGSYKWKNGLMTTDIDNQCTFNFMGTSAAAPIAAGVIALILEANGELTWRDVQHILVHTSENKTVLHNPGWRTNAAGLSFSKYFGFGFINAEMAVSIARKWQTVPPKYQCHVQQYKIMPGNEMTTSNSVEVTFNATSCTGSGKDHVNYLEHVQVTLDVNYTRLGALQVYLLSPQGTQSTLLYPRKYDNHTTRFSNWTVMTVQLWGESPKGLWKLMLTDNTTESNNGTINGASLTIHGTSRDPQDF